MNEREREREREREKEREREGAGGCWRGGERPAQTLTSICTFFDALAHCVGIPELKHGEDSIPLVQRVFLVVDEPTGNGRRERQGTIDRLMD